MTIAVKQKGEPMDDLISRTAAVDAVNRAVTKEAARRSIQELPSAQQEETFEFGKWYYFKRGYVLETTTHSFRILKDVEVSSNE